MDEFDSILQISMDKSAQKEKDQLLLQPFDYIQTIPGIQVPLRLLDALNYWVNIPADKFSLISEIIDMLRNSSLLIDDIQDNSIYRRGLPVAHSIYGVASTINAANYAYSLVLEKIQLLDHPEATKTFTVQLLDMHRGQGIDIYWRDNFTIPTELEYKVMAVQKLGALFKLGASLMQLFSTKTIDFSRLVVILGLYLQIWDDYHNLNADISEGKFGFPILHAIQNDKNSDEVLNILKQRTIDNDVKMDCISQMRALGSLKYTEDVLKSLDKEVRKEVAKLGSNPVMDSLLDDVLSHRPE